MSAFACRASRETRAVSRQSRITDAPSRPPPPQSRSSHTACTIASWPSRSSPTAAGAPPPSVRSPAASHQKAARSTALHSASPCRASAQANGGAGRPAQMWSPVTCSPAPPLPFPTLLSPPRARAPRRGPVDPRRPPPAPRARHAARPPGLKVRAAAVPAASRDEPTPKACAASASRAPSLTLTGAPPHPQGRDVPLRARLPPPPRQRVGAPCGRRRQG